MTFESSPTCNKGVWGPPKIDAPETPRTQTRVCTERKLDLNLSAVAEKIRAYRQACATITIILACAVENENTRYNVNGASCVRDTYPDFMCWSIVDELESRPELLTCRASESASPQSAVLRSPVYVYY
jgi:hypothetical protein